MSYTSWAERQQTERDDRDATLVALARDNSPQCTWWWGRRRIGAGRVLTCYVCMETITPAAAAHVLPRGAVESVMEHRALELERNRVRLVTP